MHESMSKDPVAPVLAYKHYPALERRLHKIMQYVLECLDKTAGSPESVIMNEYHNSMMVEDNDHNEDEKDDDTVQQNQNEPQQNHQAQQDGALAVPPQNHVNAAAPVA